VIYFTIPLEDPDRSLESVRTPGRVILIYHSTRRSWPTNGRVWTPLQGIGIAKIVFAAVMTN